jgi:hypothetical protein
MRGELASGATTGPGGPQLYPPRPGAVNYTNISNSGTTRSFLSSRAHFQYWSACFAKPSCLQDHDLVNISQKLRHEDVTGRVPLLHKVHVCLIHASSSVDA